MAARDRRRDFEVAFPLRDFLAHPTGHKTVPEPAREVPVLQSGRPGPAG
jgi:hypothetical protein